MQVCTWDWQAIAGILQAIAIFGAALVARSTVNSYLATRSGTRRAEVVDEASHLAAKLVRRMWLYQDTAKIRKGIELAVEHYWHTPNFDFFERNFLTPIDELLHDSVRLRELGLAGELYLGKDFELACRRIAVCYEYQSKSGHNLKTILDLASKKAKLNQRDITTEMKAALAEQEAVLAGLEGTTEQSKQERVLLDQSLKTIQAVAANFIK